MRKIPRKRIWARIFTFVLSYETAVGKSWKKVAAYLRVNKLYENRFSNDSFQYVTIKFEMNLVENLYEDQLEGKLGLR